MVFCVGVCELMLEGCGWVCRLGCGDMEMMMGGDWWLNGEEKRGGKRKHYFVPGCAFSTAARDSGFQI